MFRLSLGYIYKLNERISPVANLRPEEAYFDLALHAITARQALEEIFNSDILGLKLSNPSANRLYKLLEEYNDPPSDGDWSKKISTWRITQEAKAFEIALNEELGILPTYIVTPKGGYDINILISNPRQAFPVALTELLPASLHDVEQAAKCLAFEIPTAAGFHLHKLNELVLRHYYTAVSNGAKKPSPATLGTYLAAMKKQSVGDSKVLATEQQIKDLHRNPVLHPEVHLTTEDAIELFGIIVSAISAMLPIIRAYQQEKSGSNVTSLPRRRASDQISSTA